MPLLATPNYNRQELEALGFDQHRRIPDCRRPAALSSRAATRPALEHVLSDGLMNFLFVGRIVPNKKIEDHIRLAEHYKRYVDTEYRFIFVGKTDGIPRYYNMVRALVNEYQMPADRFIFTGAVPEEDLATYYRTARVYISLSEHEGFCVPLARGDGGTTCRSLRTRRPRCPTRSAAPASSFHPRISSSPRSFSASSPMTKSSEHGVIDGQRQRLQAFGDARLRHDLSRVLSMVH